MEAFFEFRWEGVLAFFGVIVIIATNIPKTWPIIGRINTFFQKRMQDIIGVRETLEMMQLALDENRLWAIESRDSRKQLHDGLKEVRNKVDVLEIRVEELRDAQQTQ